MDTKQDSIKFLESLRWGQYGLGSNVINRVNIEEKWLFFYTLSNNPDTQSFALYTFLIFLLRTDEDCKIHGKISTQLNFAFSFLEGAYSAALMHERRFCELSTNETLCMSRLLSYYSLPEQPLKACEAKNIVDRILKEYPDYEHALLMLPQIENDLKIDALVDDKKRVEPFLSLIEQGLYRKAREFLKDLTREQREEHLIECGAKTGSVALYTFICFYLLLDDETVATHLFAARFLDEILSKTLPIKGAHSAALMHMRRALEIDPTNQNITRAIANLESKIE